MNKHTPPREARLDLGNGRELVGHPDAIAAFRESRERETARRARWPQARFVLQVWNPSTDWKEVARELGVDADSADVLAPFNVVASIGGWDEEHRKAFLNWCEAPFWP